MLQSLIYLSEDEIELVTATINDWCRVNNCAIDSTEGRCALTAAIDLVQNKHGESRILEELTARLAPQADQGAQQ
nr:hypothetical protein [Rhizobium sp. UBA1881]